MQKLFFTFQRGLPGLALLILRLTLGITTIFYALESPQFGDGSSIFLRIVAGFALLCGICLIIGLTTPIAALVCFFGSAGIAASIIPPPINLPACVLSLIYISVTALALAILGPGSFSLDALLFGRREILIPDKPALPRR